MSSIKSKGSAAERIVFRELRKRKVYFQRHYDKVPGKPDVALPRKRRAIFIDGDFWHGRDYQKLLKANALDDFWVKKLAGNIKRDKRQQEDLTRMNWTVLRVWASDINRKSTRELEIEKIVEFLTA